MLEGPKLTDRQQQILDLVRGAIERTGAPPTRAEIANELGFKSANAAEEHLQALARKGRRLPDLPALRDVWSTMETSVRQTHARRLTTPSVRKFRWRCG